GHASHQVGLDADIWLTPMPNRELTRKEREEMSATMVVAEARRDVDPKVWKPSYTALLKTAASQPEVQRIFVNPAIKKELCREAGSDGGWLTKMRPIGGHDHHFHIRLHCPTDEPECRPQESPDGGEGCGTVLDWWLREAIIHPPPEPPKPRPPLRMADL